MSRADAALDIANLKARYCALADQCASDPQGARAGLGDIFAEDFVGDFGAGPMHGAAAIVDFLTDAIAASSTWMVHMAASPRIEVNGVEATGDWTILVFSLRRETGDVDRIIGRYSDRFRLTEDGWRITRISFTRNA